MSHSPTRSARLLGLVVAAAFAITACGGGSTAPAARGGSLGAIDLSGASFKVGSKEFTEQLILGQVALQALKAAGANVEDRTGISGTANVRTALTSGEIDMYWEYTGTGWTVHLKREAADAPKGSEQLYQAVTAADAANQVTWLPQAPANNTYAIATAQGRGQQLGVTNLTDFARLANENPQQASLCGATEFLTRDDGWPGLQKAYGFGATPTVEVDLGIVYTQIPTGAQCNFGEVFATDGRIAANKLEIVPDDKNFFVAYNVAMTGRKQVLDANPKVTEVFAPISAKLTTELLRSLNEKVDVGGQLPEDVAEQFLRENGFTA